MDSAVVEDDHHRHRRKFQVEHVQEVCVGVGVEVKAVQNSTP